MHSLDLICVRSLAQHPLKTRRCSLLGSAGLNVDLAMGTTTRMSDLDKKIAVTAVTQNNLRNSPWESAVLVVKSVDGRVFIVARSVTWSASGCKNNQALAKTHWISGVGECIIHLFILVSAATRSPKPDENGDVWTIFTCSKIFVFQRDCWWHCLRSAIAIMLNVGASDWLNLHFCRHWWGEVGGTPWGSIHWTPSTRTCEQLGLGGDWATGFGVHAAELHLGVPMNTPKWSTLIFCRKHVNVHAQHMITDQYGTHIILRISGTYIYIYICIVF